ncbi:MAG: fasciclin domain-containing protein, partial [Flavobacteriales bacterium]|nr:fasciclin domain-containing protein [Flavobacteriales bacterium]
KGTVESLLEPANKGKLSAVLTYHVLAGRFSAADVAAAIKKGNGKATMKTVAGSELVFTMAGKDLMVADAGGKMAKVTIADVNQSNGVIHVVDSVLLPKM